MFNVHSIDDSKSNGGSQPLMSGELRVPTILMGVGATITALGILLMCFVPNSGGAIGGSICLSVGLPVFTYGLVMMIIKICSQPPKSAKKKKVPTNGTKSIPIPQTKNTGSATNRKNIKNSKKEKFPTFIQRMDDLGYGEAYKAAAVQHLNKNADEITEEDFGSDTYLRGYDAKSYIYFAIRHEKGPVIFTAPNLLNRNNVTTIRKEAS